MSTELVELEDHFSPSLIIPLNDKTYTVTAVSAETGLKLQKLLALGAKAHAGQDVSAAEIELVSDDEEPNFFRMNLGATYEELLKDGISYQGLRFLASVVFVWTTQSFDVAQEMWRSGGKDPKPNRAQRRTATRTSTDAETTTRKPGSATPTSTRKATAKAGPGTKSSSTGTPSKPTSKTPE